jgi:acetoin utilization deacetylase AcuC-like enzyme
VRIPVFFNEAQIHDAQSYSRSPLKPKILAERIEKDPAFKIISSLVGPVDAARLSQTHDAAHVAELIAGKRADGFGNASQSDNRAIRTTVGNFVTAAEWALKQEGGIAWSLTAGFHHAGHKSCGGFCTYDALTLSAFELRKFHGARTLIWDEDQHYGNGCVDIIRTLGMEDYCQYVQSIYTHRMSRVDLGAYRKQLRKALRQYEPSILMYQAGADNWIGDSMPGNLSLGQLYKRDVITFAEAKEVGVPVVVNLAGGYATDYEDTLDIHMATGEAMKHVYRPTGEQDGS